MAKGQKRSMREAKGQTALRTHAETAITARLIDGGDLSVQKEGVSAMTIRTSESTVTFSHPFSLGGMDRPQPAGTYRVVFDDEEVPDMNILVLRRVGRFLHTPAIGKAGKAEIYAVSSSDLSKGLTEDLRHAQAVKAERSSI